MAAPTSPVYDDEIDVRAILQTLWKARAVIIITTLVVAVIAFVYSFWFVPRTYVATTYLFIGQPAVQFSNPPTTAGFKVSPTLPDLKAVVQLATARGLLQSVLQDPAVATSIGNEKITITEIVDMVTAVDVGKDQLSLQVADKDPKRAALIANTWGEKVSTMVNATYGLGSLEQDLDSQVSQSQQDFNQAQAALEEALSKNQVNILSAQLDNSKADLAGLLESISRSKNVLNDLLFFEQGLSGLPGETPLTLGDGLALTTLRQRSLTVASSQPALIVNGGLPSQNGNSSQSSLTVDNGGESVQIDSAAFAGYTVSKALKTATLMQAALETQLTRLQSDQGVVNGEILQLQRDFEDANAQLSQFTLKRDQAEALYTDLLETQQQVTTVLVQSSKVARVSVMAVPPDKAASRNVLKNTGLGGMAGLILTVFGVLIVNWWKNEQA